MDKISRDRVPGRADRTGRRRAGKRKVRKAEKGMDFNNHCIADDSDQYWRTGDQFCDDRDKNKIYQINNSVMITGGVVQKSIQVWTRMIRMSL